MNIVITAGGTSEYVDKVRKITNSSTGKLGSIIANKILESKNISNLYYITTKKSIFGCLFKILITLSLDKTSFS